MDEREQTELEEELQNEIYSGLEDDFDEDEPDEEAGGFGVLSSH